MSSSKNGPALTPELATQLTQAGAFILCWDVPPYTKFGIDHTVYTVGQKFKGVKMVPPGVHYIHYCPASNENDVAPRAGFFVNLSAGEVMVKEWDLDTEALVDMADRDQAQRLADAVKRFEFDSNLGPYPLEKYKAWVKLSNFITPKVIERLEPVGKVIPSVAKEFIDKKKQEDEAKIQDVTDEDMGSPTSSSSSSSSSSASSVDALETKMAAMDLARDSVKRFVDDDSFTPSSFAFYSELPSKFEAKGADASAITAMYLDKTHLLEKLMVSWDGDAQCILGELQFAFISFLVGESMEGFEQWKKMMAVLCCCDEGVKKYMAFFESFMDALCGQLPQLPKDFFIDDLSAHNFLYDCLKDYIEITSDSSLPDSFKKKLQTLSKVLKKHFNWDYEAEMHEQLARLSSSTSSSYDGSSFPSSSSSQPPRYAFDPDDEYAPTVVDLSELPEDLRAGLSG